MFERDCHGLNPELQSRHFSGSVSMSRHALTKQRYMKLKQALREAEAEERRHQASKKRWGAAARMMSRITTSVQTFLGRHAISRGVHAK